MKIEKYVYFLPVPWSMAYIQKIVRSFVCLRDRTKDITFLINRMEQTWKPTPTPSE